MRVLTVLLTVLTGLVIAGGGQGAAAADFNWRRFEGQTLRFLGETVPATPYIREKLLPEFTARTGI